MTTWKGPKYGDPFLMSVGEGNKDDTIGNEDIGLIYTANRERDLVSYMAAETQEYGGGHQIYMCVPIGRVWSDTPHPDNDDDEVVYEVQTAMAETLIERMAAAAVALGVSRETKGRENAG